MSTRHLLFAAAVAGMFAGSLPAQAQGFLKKDSDLPDASRFYMARQQVQIINDGPVVNVQNNPGSQNQQGALAPRPAPLPKAGFQSYTSEIPGLNNSLPKVNTSVPSKIPQPVMPKVPKAASAHAGKLPPPKPAEPPPFRGTRAYEPYKGYSPESTASTSGGNSNSAQSNVKGSVLHWARVKNRSY